jgi:hypothetical protein
MISPREESAAPSDQEHARIPGKDPAPDPLEQLLSRVGDDARKLVETVRRIAFLEIQRMHLKAVDGFFRGALYVCLLCAGVALSICGALFVAAGFRGAALAWTGSDWFASLATGSAVLAIVWFGGLGLRTALRGHLVRAAEHRLGGAHTAEPHPSAPEGGR